MGGVQMQVLTYRYRVKNRSGELNRMARAVNLVWNYANDAQKHAVKWGKKWPSAYDLHRLTSGTGAASRDATGIADGKAIALRRNRSLARTERSEKVKAGGKDCNASVLAVSVVQYLARQGGSHRAFYWRTA